jgi:zinc protease
MRNKNFITLIFAGAAVCLGLLSPATAQVFNPDMLTLENGLRVVVITNTRAPVIHHMMWVGAGGACDPWGHSGAAHFLEHLMFKGTAAHPGNDYSRIIARLGGEQNAFTTQDATAFYATVSRDHIEKIMALEADRFRHMRLDERVVAEEKPVILREREQRTENDPISGFFEDVDAVLYTNHPYQRPVIGWRDEIQNLTVADLQAFFNAHYVPQNMILIMGGDITKRRARTLATRYYGGLKKTSTPPGCVLPETVLSGAARLVTAESDRVDNVVWSRAWLVPPARPKTIALNDATRLLAYIMGDSRTGRLYKRLVVKDKIATEISAHYEAEVCGSGRFSLLVVPRPGVATRIVDAAINDEIKTILANGVTAEELRTAQSAIDNATIYAQDSISGPAMIVGRALMAGLDIKTIEALPWRIRAITPEAVLSVAKTIWPGVPVTAILRPKKSGDKK